MILHGEDIKQERSSHCIKYLQSPKKVTTGLNLMAVVVEMKTSRFNLTKLWHISSYQSELLIKPKHTAVDRKTVNFT